MVFGGAGEGSAGFGGAGVEGGQELFLRAEGEVWWDVGGDVEVRGREAGGGQAGKGGHVHGEFAERHGFWVGNPVGSVGGDGLQELARHGCFYVEEFEEG